MQLCFVGFAVCTKPPSLVGWITWLSVNWKKMDPEMVGSQCNKKSLMLLVRVLLMYSQWMWQQLATLKSMLKTKHITWHRHWAIWMWLKRNVPCLPSIILSSTKIYFVGSLWKTTALSTVSNFHIDFECVIYQTWRSFYGCFILDSLKSLHIYSHVCSTWRYCHCSKAAQRYCLLSIYKHYWLNIESNLPLSVKFQLWGFVSAAGVR